MFQARVTYQASPRNKIGFTYDHEALCSCPNQISATVSPEASVDRRFPLQRFVQMDWNNPVSNRLLLEASAIHRVERWGAMHLQTGKGDNIDAIAPGMVPVIDNPSLATGASLNYRAFATAAGGTFNNSWNWNLHYRAAVSYITGSHSFKVGFNNAYGHHENTSYTDPTTPYFYNFANGVPTQLIYRIAPRTVAVNVDRDLGLFAQDKWTVGRWTLSGGIRYDTFKNSFPPQAIAPTALAPNLNVRFDTIRELQPARHRAEDGRDLRSVRERQDRAQGHAQQVSGRPRHDGGVVRPTQPDQSADHEHDSHVDRRQQRLHARLRLAELRGKRGVRCARERSHLRDRRTWHHLRSRGADGLGEAVLQLGVHDQRAARVAATVVGRPPVRPEVVRQLPNDG